MDLDPSDGQERARPPALLHFLPWLAGIIPLAIGVLVGGGISRQANSGGFNAIGAGIEALALAGVVAVCAVVGFVGLARHELAIGRGALVSAGLLLVGAFVGSSAGVRIGASQPVRQAVEGQGSAGIELDGVDGYVPHPSHIATCQTYPDTGRVTFVSSLDFGLLPGGPLRGQLMWGPSAFDGSPNTISIDLWVVAGSISPGWSGVVDKGVDGPSSGTLEFKDLALRLGTGGEPPSGQPTVPPSGWPTTLSGRVIWDCGH